MAIMIEPGTVIESETLDDQCVSIPMSHRVPHPCWTGRRFQRTAVEEDLAIGEIGIENKHESGSLDDLHHFRPGAVGGGRVTRSQRHTQHIHVSLAKIYRALIDQ